MSRYGAATLDDRITRATEPIIRAAVEGSRIVISSPDPEDPPRGRPGRMIHPITGCAADTLMGAWLYPLEYFEPLLNAAWTVAESGEIALYAERSQRMREQRDAGPLLEVDPDGIATVRISGPLTKHDTSLTSMIGGTSYMHLRDQMREARSQFGAGKIRGLFVDVESAGGTAEGASETAQAIAKTSQLMPVAMHTEDKAMSGALWLASQGTRFTAGRAAEVGSMGGVQLLMDRSENFKRQGLRPVVISTGPHKAIGAPGVEISDADKEVIQRRVEAQVKPFVDDVISGRKLSEAQAEEVGKATVFIGADAQRVGLIDRICSRDEAYLELRNQIKNGGGGNGGAAPGNQPAATGDPTMSATATAAIFTAALLTRVQALPLLNCKSATEANAPEVLTAAAEQATKDLAAKDTQIQTLTGDRDTALGKIPKPPEGEILKARAAGARARVENLKLKGTLTPAMETKLQAMIGEAGKENAELFTGAEGSTPLDRVLEVFAEAPRTAPPAGAAATGAAAAPATGVVADPRLNPGGADPGAAGLAQGKAYADERLAQMNAGK